MGTKVIRPASGTHSSVVYAAGDQVVWGFELDSKMLSLSGKDLVVTFADGGEIVVEDFFENTLANSSRIELHDGTTLGYTDFIHQYKLDIQLAREQLFNSGLNAYMESGLPEYLDDPGRLIGPLERLGKLGTDYWGRNTDNPDDYFTFLQLFNTGSGPEPIVPAGELTALFMVFEDGQPDKYLPQSGLPEDTAPKDTTLEPDYDPDTGKPIVMSLTGAAPGTSVFSFTVGKLPEAHQGELFYHGVPITQGQVIMPPDLVGFSFKPGPYYSGDVNFNFSYILTSPSTGPADSAKSGVLVLHVDSVADLPEAESEGTGRTEAPGDLAVGEAVDAGDGWYMQTLEQEDSVPITFVVDVAFDDLDGSERAYLQIELPQGFTVPPGSDYILVATNTYNYARLPLPPLETLQRAGGTLSIPVTLIMDESATASAKELEIQVVTHELDGLNDAFHILSDNTAIRVVEQDAGVELFSTNLTVKVGWTYENGEGGETATADISELGLDPASKTVVGAPIIFSLSSGELGSAPGSIDGGTITFDPAAGILFYADTALVPDGNGIYTLTSAQMMSGALSFRPSPDFSDADVPMSYTVNVTDSRNQPFTVTGSTVAVVDAVADKGALNGPASAIFEHDDRVLDVMVNATFPDYVSGENHYILVEYNEGWTCLTPNDMVTVYYGADGNPLQPSGYDAGSADGYAYDLSRAAYSIRYFRIDVTAESVQNAQDNPWDYTVQLVPPAGLSDTILSVGTMSVVPPANLSEVEYDPANNVVVNPVPVEVQFVDPNAVLTPVAAYEDHNPAQNQGNTLPSTSDGFLNVALGSEHDAVNIAPGGVVTLTFRYDGEGEPGSFTDPYGQEYVFGEDDYVQIAPGVYQLTLQANIFPASTNSFSLRYNPPADDDVDLTDISISIPAVAAGSGDHVTVTATTDRLIVDAVADKPGVISGEAEYSNGHTAVITGDSFDMALRTTFGDYTNGSEQHFLIFDLNSGFSAVDIGSFPAGSTLVDGARLAELGLEGYADPRYVAVEIPNSYLAGNNGVFNATVKVTADEVTQDGTLTLDFAAVSVDVPADMEVRDSNNIAYTQGSASVEVHTITSAPALKAEIAYENDKRLDHIGEDGSNGAPLSFTGLHASEALTSVVISFDATAGTLSSSDSDIGGPIAANTTYTLSNGLTLECVVSGGTATFTVSGDIGNGSIAGEVGKLSFVPAENYSDRDVPLTVSGGIVDVASGMTGSFGPDEVAVVVDAVAQQPQDIRSLITYNGRPAAYAAATVTVSAVFHDADDGSEQHFLLVEAKNYFNTDGMELVTVAFDNAGNTLSPNAAGTGWLKPQGGTDAGVQPASTKTFIKIPVDDVVSQYNTAAGGEQTIGSFTVEKTGAGEFSVSYTGEIAIDTSLVPSDITNDPLQVGGMSAETARPGATTPSGGQEAYQYNNTSYALETTSISIAVVETLGLTLYTGYAYEENAPNAHTGDSTFDPANGGPLLIVRETPETQPPAYYADEEVTVTFSYNALYEEGGGRVSPGDIYYNGQKVEGTLDPSTGRITVTLTVPSSDTSSVIDQRDYPTDPQLQTGTIDQSNIRFVPSQGTFNESDIGLSYEFSVEDTASGAVVELTGGNAAVVIDAVADQPEIVDAFWNFGNADYSAAAGANVPLKLTINYPDTGTDGVFSEKHFILVEKITTMDLDPAFKAAVAAAGYNITDYAVAPGDGGPSVSYYRIPALYFTNGSESAEPVYAEIPMVVTGGVSADSDAPMQTPNIIAQAIVSTPHGGEPVADNNESLVPVQVPPLNFAVVDTSVSPQTGKTIVYEDDTPNAHLGDYTAAGGVEFSLGLNVGTSPGGGPEEVTPITFRYETGHGTLYYSDDSTWHEVPNNGTVPPEYSGNLRYIPKNTKDSTADLDQLLHYTFSATDPASGATRDFEGDYKIVVDAVADQPDLQQAGPPVYNDSTNGYLYHDQDVTIPVTVNFPHWQKTADGHTKNFILIQVPGEMWTTDYPGADIYTINGEPYFRFPASPDDVDDTGTVTLNLTLHTPPRGYLLTYENLNTFKVGALTIDRDPSFASSSLDEEPFLNNNLAFAETDDIAFVFDPGDYKYMHIDPMYENNHPNANELLEGPDGKPTNNPDLTEDVGKVHLPDTILVDDGTGTGTLISKDVSYVVLTWEQGKGDLYVGGTNMGSGGGPVTVPKGDLGNVYIQLNDAYGYKDYDFGTVHAEVHTVDNGVYNDSSSPIVDAVAQVPTDVDSSVVYGGGNTSLPPGENVLMEVEAKFYDLDGSEEHYVLVEYDPLHWQNPGTYNTVVGPDGKTYFQVPVGEDDIDELGNARVTVTLPPPTGGLLVGDNGEVEYRLGTGAMSVQHPVDGEVRADNNEAFNLTDTVTVSTSGAESNPVVHTSNAYANSDIDGDGVQDGGGRGNIWIDGLNVGSDTIPKVTLTYSSEHGEIVYNNAPLAGHAGVEETVNGDGTVTLTITDAGVIDALLAGSAGSSAVQYVPNGYYDTDVTVSGSIVVDDVFSSDSKTVSNSSTIIVDAVARHPEGTGIQVTDPDFNGAVKPGDSVPFTADGRFPDMGDQAGCQHYLAIQQLSGWEIDGPTPPGVFVASYDGVVYYVISADDYGNGGSPALTNDGNGNYSFTLNLKSPDATKDETDISSIKGGAITIASNTDGELTFDNNTSISVEEIPLSIAVVETTEVDFVFAPVIEDSLPGTPIVISDASKSDLSGNNERVTETDFTFSGDFSGNNPGDVVGTIVYGDNTYPVTVSDSGTATAHVDFGSSGYEPGKDFNLVWGNASFDGSGNLVVSEWNHTGSDMSVSTSSTVVDNASGDTGTAPGNADAGWVPTADPPADLSAVDPPRAVGAGEEVTFTVSGHFEDIDGSEDHYFLVERKPGWTGDYETVTVGDMTYFVVPVPSGLSDPEIDVTLTTPPPESPPGADESITLIVSGGAVDGASMAKTPGAQDASVTIDIAVVNATSVDLTLASDTINEDTWTQMTFSLNGGNNDAVTSIILTDLGGGSIVDAAGNPVFSGAPAALDVQAALSGEYYYKPPPYASGGFSIGYDAVVTDNASGSNVTFNESTDLTVAPITNLPHDPNGTDDAPVTVPGHKAETEVTLQAVFDDNDGSETHFFLFTLPAGLPAQPGLMQETDAAVLAASGLSVPVYRVEADASGQATFTLNLPPGYAGGPLEFKAGAVESGTTDYQFSGAATVAVPDTGTLNLPPDAQQKALSVSASNPTESGSIPLDDPDGDSVSIVGVTVNGTQEGTTAGAYAGLYGTLELNGDGDFTYTKGSGAGEDVFGITVQDSYGATSTSYITVTVTDAALRSLYAAGEEDAVFMEQALAAGDFGTAEDAAQESMYDAAHDTGIVDYAASASLLPENAGLEALLFNAEGLTALAGLFVPASGKEDESASPVLFFMDEEDESGLMAVPVHAGQSAAEWNDGAPAPALPEYAMDTGEQVVPETTLYTLLEPGRDIQFAPAPGEESTVPAASGWLGASPVAATNTALVVEESANTTDAGVLPADVYSHPPVLGADEATELMLRLDFFG